MLARILMPALLAALLLVGDTSAADKLRALIVDGQNNHNWQETTPLLQKLLEETGLFHRRRGDLPAKGEDVSGFCPISRPTTWWS